jgi:integrase
MATSQINTDRKRERLEPQNAPYWEQLAKRKHVGYRKGLKSDSWIARLDRKSAVIGDSSMSYEDAREVAVAWCSREESGINKNYPVSDCVADYVEYLRLNNSDKSADSTKGRLAAHLTPELLKTPVRKLTTQQLEKWRNGMVPTGVDAETARKKKDSANRVWSMLRAGLNKAFQSGVVDSSTAWVRVKPFKSVSASRDLFLTDKQVKTLLSKTDGALHNLIKAGVLTGARLGELTAARVCDLEGGILKITGKTGRRDCFLSKDTETFLKIQTKGKLPAAALLTSPDGAHWKKSEHQRLFQKAVKKAKLPADTVFYSLRHYYISKALLSSVNVQVLAENCGTSVRMIEAHYGKFMKADRRRMLDAVDLGGVGV